MPDNPSGLLPASSGIGALRWFVTLYSREQRPGRNTAISESLRPRARVHADIQPAYPSTFYLAAQTERPISHLIRLRWQDYVETTEVVIRTTIRPNDNTKRSELFRVRRVKEVGGRKRFAELECELERHATTIGDSDTERELIFAENPSLGEARWDDGHTRWDDGSVWA